MVEWYEQCAFKYRRYPAQAKNHLKKICSFVVSACIESSSMEG